MACSSATANAASVGVVGEAGEQLGERGVADGARGPDAGHLAVVLHGPVGLDEPFGGDELDGAEHRGEGALLGPGDAVGLEAEPADAAGLSGEDGVLVGLGGADLDAGVDARVGQLLADLGLVAAVGDHEQVVGGDEQRRGRPGEPGEVAHVGEPGDEQRVDAGVPEPGPEPAGPAGHVHWRRRAAHRPAPSLVWSTATAASAASR